MGLLGAYTYNPENKSTTVLYNVSSPVQPPALDDSNANGVLFYGNASQELNLTKVDSCPTWCVTELNSTSWADVPPCGPCDSAECPGWCRTALEQSEWSAVPPCHSCK